MKKTDVKFSFVFHGVGQGLSYSGEIICREEKKKTFRFIYDCGTESNEEIKKSIEDEIYSGFTIRKNTKNKKEKVDLLILSHLHNDHTNCLDTLFGKFAIDEVILPYLYPIERLILALEIPDESELYYTFLSDPVEFLLARGVKKIILVRRENNSGNGSINEEISPIPSPDKICNSKSTHNFKDYPERLNANKTLKKEIEKEESKQNPKFMDYIKENKVIITDKPGYFTYCNCKWLFAFFNYPVSQKTLKDFEKCVNKCIKEINGYLDACDTCINGNKKNKSKLHIKDIIQCISNNAIRRKLKDCYKKNFPGKNETETMNNTSLIMYHGPIQNYKIKKDCAIKPTLNPHKLDLNEKRILSLKTTFELVAIDYLFRFFFAVNNYVINRSAAIKGIRAAMIKGIKLEYLKKYIYSENPKNLCNYKSQGPMGQLLTGDINLNYNYESIKKYYQNYLERILVALVPHHGSKENWNKNIHHESKKENILKDIKNGELWVISAGLGNTYGHPSIEVIKDIVRNILLHKSQSNCAWVNEMLAVFIKGELEYK